MLNITFEFLLFPSIYLNFLMYEWKLRNFAVKSLFYFQSAFVAMASRMHFLQIFLLFYVEVCFLPSAVSYIKTYEKEQVCF